MSWGVIEKLIKDIFDRKPGFVSEVFAKLTFLTRINYSGTIFTVERLIYLC